MTNCTGFSPENPTPRLTPQSWQTETIGPPLQGETWTAGPWTGDSRPVPPSARHAGSVCQPPGWQRTKLFLVKGCLGVRWGLRRSGSPWQTRTEEEGREQAFATQLLAGSWHSHRTSITCLVCLGNTPTARGTRTHFTEEDTEAWAGEGTCPKSQAASEHLKG